MVLSLRHNDLPSTHLLNLATEAEISFMADLAEAVYEVDKIIDLLEQFDQNHRDEFAVTRGKDNAMRVHTSMRHAVWAAYRFQFYALTDLAAVENALADRYGATDWPSKDRVGQESASEALAILQKSIDKLMDFESDFDKPVTPSARDYDGPILVLEGMAVPLYEDKVEEAVKLGMIKEHLGTHYHLTQVSIEAAAAIQPYVNPGYRRYDINREDAIRFHPQGMDGGSRSRDFDPDLMKILTQLGLNPIRLG